MSTELSTNGVMGDVPWGTHFCYFYETQQDLIDTLVPFFQAGLANGDLCIWVISEPLTLEQAQAALARARPDLNRHLAAGNIEIRPHNEHFFRAGPGSPDGIVSFLRDHLQHALSKGHSGMRVAGSSAGLQKRDGWRFAEFEREIELAVTGQRMIVLCAFPLAASGAAEIFDAARTHQFAVARRQGEWQIVETPDEKRAQTVNDELRREIEDRKYAEAELRRQKELLETIFGHIPAMIHFVGQDHQLMLVNREWERTLGWTLDEIRQQNVDILAENYPDPAYRAEVEQFLRTSSAEWRDFKTLVRDGRVIDTSWAVLYLSDGTAIGIGQDITRRKRAEEALRDSQEQLRALSASLQSAREREAATIARRIHDELGGMLTSLRWELEGVDKLLTETVANSHLSDLKAKLEMMFRLADASIHSVRRIASEVRPSILDDIGLAEAVEWQAQQFQSQTGLVCECSVTATNLPLDAEQSTAAFRILQEALTNVRRHAQATWASVALEEHEGALVLTISDNGRGIEEAKTSGIESLGLLGMRERAYLAGGAIEIGGAPGKGTTVTLRIPLQAPPELVSGNENS